MGGVAYNNNLHNVNINNFMWEKVTVHLRIMHPDFIGFITTPLLHYLDTCYIGWITRVLFAGLTPTAGLAF